MIKSGSKVQSHLATIGVNGQEISWVHLAAIRCNGLDKHHIIKIACEERHTVWPENLTENLNLVDWQLDKLNAKFKFHQ